MVATEQLAARLQATAPKLDLWRIQAEQLRGLVEAARLSGTVSESLLESVEETAGAIYAEIAFYNGLAVQEGELDADIAAELAEIGDALHLVLMEITELSTRMYAVRSA